MKYVVIPMVIILIIALILSYFRTDKEESFYDCFEEWILILYFFLAAISLSSGFIYICVKFWDL